MFSSPGWLLHLCQTIRQLSINPGQCRQCGGKCQLNPRLNPQSSKTHFKCHKIRPIGGLLEPQKSPSRRKGKILLNCYWVVCLTSHNRMNSFEPQMPCWRLTHRQALKRHEFWWPVPLRAWITLARHSRIADPYLGTTQDTFFSPRPGDLPGDKSSRDPESSIWSVLLSHISRSVFALRTNSHAWRSRGLQQYFFLPNHADWKTLS